MRLVQTLLFSMASAASDYCTQCAFDSAVKAATDGFCYDKADSTKTTCGGEASACASPAVFVGDIQNTPENCFKSTNSDFLLSEENRILRAGDRIVNDYTYHTDGTYDSNSFSLQQIATSFSPYSGAFFATYQYK